MVIVPCEGAGDRPAGLGTWRGLEGEFTMRIGPGEAWGSMEGEGLMLGGEARLKLVAGLEPKGGCVEDCNQEENV